MVRMHLESGCGRQIDGRPQNGNERCSLSLGLVAHVLRELFVAAQVEVSIVHAVCGVPFEVQVVPKLEVT